MNLTRKTILLLALTWWMSAACLGQPAPTTNPSDIADRIAGTAIVQGQYADQLKAALTAQAQVSQAAIAQANAAATAATQSAATDHASMQAKLDAANQLNTQQAATIAKLTAPPTPLIKDVVGILAAISDGQTTITPAPGIYRQMLVIPNGGITIDGGTLGQVVFDGADPIAGWVKDSSTINPVYSAAWSLVPKINGAEYATYDPAKAVSLGLPEGVGFGSQFIWQAVANDVVHEANLIQRVDYADAAGASHPGRARLSAGTFYIDKAAARVYIWLPGGANPATGQVLGSSRAHPISGPASSTLKNIVIRHACNFAQDAMLNTNDGWKLLNVICERANAGDISVNNKTISLDNVTAQYGGQLGFAGHLAKGTRLTGCTNGPGNNAKGFSHGGEASCKFAACDGLVFDAWKAFDNFGNNTWLDVTNGNITFTNSVFSGKGDLGLISEIGVGQLTMTNCTFDGPGGQVLIAERSNDASKLSSGPYTFGVDINHCVLKNGASIQLRGLPLGSPPRLMPINVSITYNQLIDSFIATNAGVFDASSITTNHYTIDHNQYSGAGKLIHWGNGSGNAGVDYGTLASVRTALHIEANGTSNR